MPEEMSSEIGFKNRRGDLIGPEQVGGVEVANQVRARAGEMGARVEMANPVSREELRYTKSAAFEAPPSLIGPNKYRDSLPANPLINRQALPFSSIDLIVNRPGIAGEVLRTDFEIESAQLEVGDPDLVAAARGVVDIHHTYAIMQITAKSESVFGVMGRKESNPIPLAPDAIADVLEYDAQIGEAFVFYLKAAGFDSIPVDASVTDRLLDNTLTRAELVSIRKEVSMLYGTSGEAVAFALAAELGVFCLGPKAREVGGLVTPDGDKKKVKDPYLWKTTNPLFIGHARTIAESKWVGSEARSFIESAGINMGAKRKCTLADVIALDSLEGAYEGRPIPGGSLIEELIAGLRNMPESAVKNYWKKMNGLKELHESLEWINMKYDPVNKVYLSNGISSFERKTLLVFAVDGQVITEGTAEEIGRDIRSEKLKFKE